VRCIGLGLLFGIALQRSQVDSGLEVLAVPWVQLIIFVVLAAVVGVLYGRSSAGHAHDTSV
jgi:putative ABC transport system permease protein